jgi:hypothetical protein
LEVIGPIGLMLALQTVLESGYQPGAFCRFPGRPIFAITLSLCVLGDIFDLIWSAWH